MTANSPSFDVDSQQLVTRLFDLCDAGDFSNGELLEVDSTIYTRMAAHYGLELADSTRTFS